MLKLHYSHDFQKVQDPNEERERALTLLQIVTEDDYMPMPIGNDEEYDKIISISWYTPDKAREELAYAFPRSMFWLRSLTRIRFPCVLPFSQMYPACCIDIRSFLNQFLLFLDDHFQHPSIVDETLKKVARKRPSLSFATSILTFV